MIFSLLVAFKYRHARWERFIEPVLCGNVFWGAGENAAAAGGPSLTQPAVAVRERYVWRQNGEKLIPALKKKIELVTQLCTLATQLSLPSLTIDSHVSSDPLKPR